MLLFKRFNTKKLPKNIDELITAVEESFQQFDPTRLNDNFLTLATCLRETMMLLGSNAYKIPHMGKEKLKASGSSSNSNRVPNKGYKLFKAVEQFLDCYKQRRICKENSSFTVFQDFQYQAQVEVFQILM